jgi:hypothetical protein
MATRQDRYKKSVQLLRWTVIIAMLYLIFFRWEWKGDLGLVDIFISTYILSNLIFTLNPYRNDLTQHRSRKRSAELYNLNLYRNRKEGVGQETRDRIW